MNNNFLYGCFAGKITCFRVSPAKTEGDTNVKEKTITTLTIDRHYSIGVLVGLIAVFVAAVALADGKSAKSLLRDLGLRKAGRYYILSGEKELANGLRSLTPLRKNLADAVSAKKKFEQRIKNAKNERLKLLAYQSQLGEQLGKVDDVEDHNEIIAKLNSISIKIRVLSEQIYDAERLDTYNEAIAQARTDYTRRIAELQKLQKQVIDDYQVLTANQDVISALSELSEGEKAPYKLGPRSIFEKTSDNLARYNKVIKREVIPLRNRVDTFMVDTVLNGEHAVAMILDTGASTVFLSTRIAKEAGLNPSENDPIYRVTVADGRVVEARRMQLDSLSVGSFTIFNVECVVFPEEEKNITPLLGGTFLKNFTYMIDPALEQLTLIKENLDEEETDTGR